jgi:hypothetical protein
MEYSNNQSNNLGNSKIQGILTSSLYGEKYTTDTKKNNVNVVFQPNGSFFSLFMDTKNNESNNGYGLIDISDSNNNEMVELSEDDSNNKNGKFNFIKDPMNSFFVGSITVVGLFVLFRLLQKNK